MTGREGASGRAPSDLLTLPGAVPAWGPDAGVAWHYGDPVSEQRALEAGEAIVDASHLGVVRVTGPRRLTWLNALTTQKLDDLAPGDSRETLVLDPHGHIEHAIAAVDDGETTWLITEDPAGLTAWLDSMRFATPVSVEDTTDDWAVAMGREGSSLREALTWRDPWPGVAPGGTSYSTVDGHPGADWRSVLWLVPRGELAPRLTADGVRLAGTWAAQALRVAAWRPRATHEVDDRALPHELDWLRTAVHLDKGCYRGQETVAKVHNVGKPPRRLVMLHLDGSADSLPAPGEEVLESGAAVGHVTSAARHHELGPIALALVKRNVDPDLELVALAQGELVAAAQEIIVSPSGESADRPEVARPPSLLRRRM